MGIDEYVGGLDVPMDDVLSVAGCDAIQDGAHAHLDHTPIHSSPSQLVEIRPHVAIHVFEE